jgi:nucleoside-diphosphate-sugar epimerase
MDVVFHAGAVPGIWGPRKVFWDINVGGTEHVLAGCRDHGVAKLVFTSSPSVVFGEEEVCGIDESTPYPARYLTHYPETKARAEQLVLAANDANLATVALRPHYIWGPGDTNLIPRVIDRARRGRLIQVGDGQNLVDITYIDNCAAAHLLAAERLSPGAACAGRAYFIANAEPVRIWPWLDGLMKRLGVRGVRRRMPYGLARGMGFVSELVYGALGIRREPLMTRFLAAQLAKSHYFNMSAARRDLDYEPAVSNEEGVDRLVAWYGRHGLPVARRSIGM